MTKLQARAPVAAAPAPPPAPVTGGVAEERLVSLEQEVRRELGGVAARLDQADTRLAAAQEADTRTRAQLQELLSRPAPAQDTRATPPPPPPAPCPAPQEDVSELKMFVLQTVEAAKDLVRAPLSVVFDAVRSEDFIGEDNYLTFSKAIQMIQISNTYLMTTNCRRTLTWAMGWMWTAGGSRCRCRGSTCSCSTCTPRPGTPWCSPSGQWPQRFSLLVCGGVNKGNIFILFMPAKWAFWGCFSYM